VSVLITKEWRVCKIMNEDSDRVLKHGKWFGGSGRSVYKERCVGIGGSPCFFLYSCSCIPMKSTTLEIS
jgi:hypothetical protein